MKKIISILLAFILSIGVLAIPTTAATKPYIKVTKLEQPADTGDYKDHALYLQVRVVGHKDKKLRLRIKDSDGNEIHSYTSSKITKDDYYFGYYWNGRDKNGYRYPDATYTIQTWIYGDDSTLVTGTYYLDLKGTIATTQYIKVTKIEQPKDNSEYKNQALYLQFRVVGHKGKKLRLRIKDAKGNELHSHTSSKQNKDDYTYSYYWNGADKNGNRYPDGTYTIQTWIYGDDSTLVTNTYNLNLKGT